MRKLLFYLFMLRKVFLLFIYPAFEHDGKIFVHIRKDIENFLIFQPSRLRAKRVQRDILKKINPQRFINAEGIKLYAWFIKPKGNNPVMLHFHGQAESILSHQEEAAFCIENGLGLFMLSYRGHYKSGGKATVQGVFNDAQAAIMQLKKLGVDEDKIILWGHSLGTAVAVETAIHKKVAGVILQSPIKEIKSAAIDIYKFYYNKLHLSILSKPTSKHISRLDSVHKLDNLNKVEKITCPLLIMHSKSDSIASFQNSIDLAAKNKKAELYLVDHGNHWDVDWCLDKIFEFTESLGYNDLVNSKM